MLIVTLGQWLSRGKGLLFPKVPENELFALKVWGKIEKSWKEKVGFEPSTSGVPVCYLSIRPQRTLTKWEWNLRIYYDTKKTCLSMGNLVVTVLKLDSGDIYEFFIHFSFIFLAFSHLKLL